MKKVCVVTGTRAEYGLLKTVIRKIDLQFNLQLVVTGMHLSPEFGMTYREIEDDGFQIDEKIEILLSSDTPVGISKSMGLAMISFSECFTRLKPDLIVVLGDRYEIFSAVSAASVGRIPVAHLYGGETTEGAFDESFRHSITKMSQLHFTSTREYGERVIQLGEDPRTVHVVGSLGIENINTMKLLSKYELEKSIQFRLDNQTALVTYHPVTLENSTAEEQFSNLLNALEDYQNLKIIFTKANSDTDGRIINKLIDTYVDNNSEKAIAFTSMGQNKYLSAMQFANIVIGNSSSGIIEAPSFQIPTVNIGDRQKGRVQAESIINCKPEKEDISFAISKALSISFLEEIKGVINPYEQTNVSDRIIEEINKALIKTIELKKHFYNLKK